MDFICLLIDRLSRIYILFVDGNEEIMKFQTGFVYYTKERKKCF